MSLHAILTTAVLFAPAAFGNQDDAGLAYEFETEASPASGILAIQVGVAETMSDAGTLRHAVILIEDGKIVTIGEDLLIERGIPVLDKDPEWVVMPGLIDAYTRLGLDSRAGGEFAPTGSILPELYPQAEVYEDILEYGVTTLGMYPPGSSVPGQASVVRPIGSTKDEMILQNESYLKIVMESSSRSKRALRGAWKKVEKYEEKDEKARAKWEKDQAKKKKKKKKDKDKDKDKDKADDEYQSLKPDADEQVLLDLVAGEKTALVAIRKAADYLHFLDALDDNEIDYALRMPLVRESDFFNISERIGELGCPVIFEPSITLHPGTMRQRNLPAEFARAGASLILIPRSDNARGMRDWLLHTSQLVSAGLDRDVALAAMTIEPAKLLGIDEQLGSLEKEKAANMVFFNGDPLEVGTRIEAVMIDGKFEFTREEL